MGEMRWEERKSGTTHSLPLHIFIFVGEGGQACWGTHWCRPIFNSSCTWCVCKPSWLLCLECSFGCVLSSCPIAQGVSKFLKVGLSLSLDLHQNPTQAQALGLGVGTSKAHPVPWEGHWTRCQESPFRGLLSSSVWGGQLRDLPGACSDSIKWTEFHHEFLRMLVLPLNQCLAHPALGFQGWPKLEADQWNVNR